MQLPDLESLEKGFPRATRRITLFRGHATDVATRDTLRQVSRDTRETSKLEINILLII
ncbi:hypothetical protein Hdeb2414_s0015g00451281 [Helianthus debilis subsp. tardiflorus]